MSKLIVFVSLLLFAILPAQAAGVTVCRDATNGGGLRFIFSGINWDSDPAPWYSALGATAYGDKLLADAFVEGELAGTAIFGYWNGIETIQVVGSASTRSCGSGWQPSATSIQIPAPNDGPYLLEIQDAYGNWSLVTDAAHPDGIVLYNNGGHVELIGSVGQDTNPAHYRLVDPNEG